MAESLLDTFLNCPVCFETFTEPVTLGCHHSFCSSCLRDYWAQKESRACPVCRRRSSKDITDIDFRLKELSLQFREKTSAQTGHQDVSSRPSHTERPAVCDLHPDTPPLFCKDEGRALCPVCEFSEHQRHTVVRVKEVQEELKEQVRTDLQSLTEQRDRYKTLERTYKQIQKHTDTQAQRCESHIRAVFKHLHLLLDQEETRALEELREETHRQAHTMSPELGRIREELASMETTIQELKELLQKDTVLHYRPQGPLPTTPALAPGLLLDQAKVLGNLGFRVWRRLRREVSYSPVVLDINTAHPYLCVSEDLRGVRCGETKHIPLNPERFFFYTSVLGAEGFTSGCHQWEVEVGDHPHWAVGVVKESVKRKEWAGLNLEYGVWRLVHYRGTYFNVFHKPLTLQQRPEKIRIQLDYDRGQLTFTDAGHMTLICSYEGSFTEKMFPYFFVGYAEEAQTEELRVCPSDWPSEV